MIPSSDRNVHRRSVPILVPARLLRAGTETKDRLARLPWYDEAGLVRGDDGLGAVAQTELAQYPADVGLDGLGVVAVSGEYSTGMIGVTLAAMPRRPTMLAAKAVVIGALALVAGTMATLGSMLAGRLILPASGFTPTNGFTLLSLADGSTQRAAVGSVLYLALIAILSLGIGAAVRDAATAIGVVLGLLFMFPIVAALAPDPDWERRLQKIGPMSAGLNIQATTGLRELPLSPWAGMGVVAAWAAAALVTGGVVLRLRDA